MYGGLSTKCKGDTDMRDKIRESIIAAANRRRAPGNVEAFEPGTPVRVASAEYLKESLHSNETKMAPKWSKAVFTVMLKWGPPVGDSAPPPSSMAAQEDLERIIQPWARAMAK